MSSKITLAYLPIGEPDCPHVWEYRRDDECDGELYPVHYCRKCEAARVTIPGGGASYFTLNEADFKRKLGLVLAGHRIND